jgi:hypothetical protein
MSILAINLSKRRSTSGPKIYFSPIPTISGILGNLSLQKEIVVQFGVPMTLKTFISWSKLFDPRKSCFLKIISASTQPNAQISTSFP